MSFIDLSTGTVSLRTDADPLRPLMQLNEFARSPLASGFSRGFEKRHFAWNGYLIGGYRLSGVNFNVSLGFSAPNNLVAPEDCVLQGVSLTWCIDQGKIRRRRRRPLLLDLALAPFQFFLESIRGPRYSAEQIRQHHRDSPDWYRAWLSDALDQDRDKQFYPPWGYIALMTDTHGGPSVQIVFDE